MNNKLHIQTKILIRLMIQQLSVCIETANKIDDKESKFIVSKVVAQKRNITNVLDNIARGNIWLSLFYLKEILEQVLLADDW
jgi:hypothetical protein